MLRIGRDIALDSLVKGMAVICHHKGCYSYTNTKAICIIKGFNRSEQSLSVEVVATANEYSSGEWSVDADNFSVIDTKEQMEELIHDNRMKIYNERLKDTIIFGYDSKEVKEIDISTIRYLNSIFLRDKSDFDFDIDYYTATISKGGTTIEVTQDNAEKLEIDNLVGLAYLLYLNKIKKNSVYTDNKVEEYLKKNPKYKVRIVGV